MIEFTEEHRDIREMIADFSDNELAPRAESLDESGTFPTEALGQLAELGLLGASLPEEFGGGGGDHRMATLVFEELARGCGSTASVVLAHALVADALAHGGTDGGKAHLGALASGEKLGALLCSEPECAAAADVTTTAKSSGDGFVLNGTKSNVIAAREAKIYAVVARTDDDQVGLFVVDGGAEASGAEVTRDDRTMGLRPAGVGEVTFDGAAAIQVGDGAVVDRTLALGRVGVGALSVGLARGALQYALQYASERSAFGRTIDRFEALQLKFAESDAGIEGARLLVYRAAQLVDNGANFERESYQCRFAASSAAFRATKEAVQVLGGNGYSREYPVERAYRDVHTLSVMGGAEDTHRLSLARVMIGVDR